MKTDIEKMRDLLDDAARLIEHLGGNANYIREFLEGSNFQQRFVEHDRTVEASDPYLTLWGVDRRKQLRRKTDTPAHALPYPKVENATGTTLTLGPNWGKIRDDNEGSDND